MIELTSKSHPSYVFLVSDDTISGTRIYGGKIDNIYLPNNQKDLNDIQKNSQCT